MIQPTRRAVALLALAALVVAPAAPAAAAPDAPPASRQARALPASVPSAEVALARAEALFAPRATPGTALRAAAGTVTRAGRDATLVLRDLAARLDELAGPDRAAAEALLARPNGGDTRNEAALGALWGQPEAAASPVCSATLPLCVHWSAGPARGHAPPVADVSPANGVPDQVDATLATMEQVWTYEVDTLDYKPPLTDERGSIDDADTDFDVYLSDIGDAGYYGYCAIDDSRTFKNYLYYDRSAYCVLDDDYVEFPTNTPLENLQVTAAHEFFHAVQFAYDAFEDRWFMESTAAWVEDEAYTTVNDNRQYLSASQLTRPLTPLDKGKGGAEYGSWIFFRYLSEHFTTPDVVRRSWEWADNSPDQLSSADLATYSLPAIDTALQEWGSDLQTEFGDFAAANTTPAAFYDEGGAYQPASLAGFRVSPSRPTTQQLYVDLKHLSSLSALVRPGRGTAADARLRVTVNGPALATQPEARVVIRYRGADPVIRRLTLDRDGDGSRVVPFGKGTVTGVVVSLVNASSRYSQCFTGDPYGGLSCWGGTPRDDGRRYVFRAALR